MTGLVQQLLPEMVGLLVTPAAIVACLLLLDSSRPVRDVTLFAASFITLYVVISVAVVAGGAAAASGGGGSDARAWVSIVVGALFLAGGVLALVRHRSATTAPRTPGWVHTLEDPDARTVLVAGLALSAINPNLAILASGLTAIATADVSDGDRVVGVALLLGACLLDFVLPTLAYVLLGRRARTWLADAKDWLILHNGVIGIVVLVVFGLLFLVRGLADLP